MHARLVAYTPLGARIGVLPDSLAFTFTDPFGADLPTLGIEYTKHGRRSADLETRPEVAVEWWDDAAGEWVEPENARLHVVKRSWNSKDDGEQARKYDAVHVGWLTRKARVWTGANMNSDGKRQFNAANAGTIIGTLFDDAQSRGWGPGLSRGFTATLDSAGQPWATAVTMAFDPSSDLHSVIAAIVEQGLAEVTWAGRELRLYNPDTTLGRDLTTGDAPVWVRHSGGGITSAPEEASIEDLMTAARLVGDAGGTWDVTNPEADPTYGRLEAYVTQAGVTDEGTANLLIEQELAAGAAERVQFTREWHSAAATFLPWRDYRPGDWVFVDREDGDTITRERSRVVQVSVTVNSDGLSGHTTLGTRLDDYLTRLARATAGVTGGAVSGGAGGSPSPTPPEGPDSRVPAAVQGLVGSSQAYLDAQGVPQARVALDWADVTTDVENVLLGVRGYEVWCSVEAGPWVQVATVANSEVALSPLPVGEAQQYRVRAVSDNYITGGWSATIPITTAADTTPPPKPSAPILSTRLGMVTVAWDNEAASGGGMPADFDRLDVRIAGNIAGYDEHRFLGPIPSGSFGTGAPSDGLVVRTEGLKIPEPGWFGYYAFAVGAPGPAQLMVGLNVVNASSDGLVTLELWWGDPNDNASVVTLASASSWGVNSINGETLTLRITGNRAQATVSGIGLSAEVDALPAPITGEVAMGDLWGTDAGQGTADYVQMRWTDVRVFDQIVGRLNITGSGLSQMVISRDYLPTTPDEPVQVYFRAFDTSGNASDYSDVSSIFVQKIDGADIEANSVTTNELSAGAIDGMVITGALFQTTHELERGLKFDDFGFRAYNPLGVRTFNIDPVTGGVEMVGELATGPYGDARVELTGALDYGVSQVRLNPGEAVAGWDTTEPGFLTHQARGGDIATHGAFIEIVTAQPTGGLERGRLRLYSQTGGDASMVAYGAFYLRADFEVGEERLRILPTGDFRLTGAVGTTFSVNPSGVVSLGRSGGNRITIPASGNVRVYGGLEVTTGTGSTWQSITSAGITAYGNSLIGGDLVVNDRLDIKTVPSGNGPTLTYNTGNGRVRQTGSSSRRFKENIRPLDIDPERVLDVSAHVYDRNDMEPGEDTREIGFIAEEVEALGITDLLFYENDGQVHGVDYLRWCVALHHATRSLRDRITELEERNT